MTLTPLVTGGALGHTRRTVNQELSNPVVQFGGVEVDMRLREVRRGTDAVRLQDQPFQLLALMLARPGDVVTREDIRQRLWPDGTSVDFEHSVNAVVKRLRAVLGDDATQPRFVETLPRQGYRFIGTLEDREACARPPAPAPRPRLVVLPFTNLTGDPSHDYFIDGFTEELIAQLGHRFADRVGVLARTSAMLYKDVRRGAADIGEALRVDYLIEGSVRVGGDRVRITAQLIETRGETHLWAHSYDREYTNCLAVQADVAAEIAVTMTRELFPPPAARSEAPTRVPGAHEAYLTGRFHWNRSGPVGIQTAIAFYDQALGHDPGFGRAHSSRARAFLSLSEYYVVPPGDALRSARDAAGRALAIDPDDPDAWVVIAEARRVLDHDPAGARAAYEKVLAMNASSECALRYYAWFLGARSPGAEAIAVADRGFSLDPLCIVMQTCAADVHYLSPGLRGRAVAQPARARDGSGVRAGTPIGVARPRPARARRRRGRDLRRRPRTLGVPDVAGDQGAAPWSRPATSTGLAPSRGASNAPARIAWCRRITSPRCTAPWAITMPRSPSWSAPAPPRDGWLDAVGVDPRFACLRDDDRLHAIRARLRLA